MKFRVSVYCNQSFIEKTSSIFGLLFPIFTKENATQAKKMCCDGEDAVNERVCQKWFTKCLSDYMTG